MASHDQASRNKESEPGVRAVEEERVPQFEYLTVSPPKEAEHGGGETERAPNVGKFEMLGEEQGDAADIAKYRQAAQQSSINALSAAEERYNKAKEVTSEKTSQAKDTLAGAGKTAADYTGQAKDYVADTVAETGKGTAGYVGSVATTVRDKAVVAGWGAGEYTAEKVADATKAVANVTAGAAGYVGKTAVAAKDKVGSVGVSAKDYAAQKLGAAKDAVVATQESAKDYAARKREEAEREMLAKQSAQSKGEVWSGPNEDIAGGGRQTVEQGGGVLQDIGETVLEIGQTTKELLVGKGQTQSTVKDPADINK